jgi:hypothetical protein
VWDPFGAVRSGWICSAFSPQGITVTVFAVAIMILSTPRA